MTRVDGAQRFGAFPVSFSARGRAGAFARIGDAEREPYDRRGIRRSVAGGAAANEVSARDASRAIDGFEKYRFHLLHPVGRPLRG